MSLDSDLLQKEYTGEGSLKSRQVDRVKAITKSLQKIDYPPIKAFIIIVEGNDDIILYSPIFNDTLCKIVPLCGIQNVKLIFKKIPSKHDRSKEMRDLLKNEDNQEKINTLSRMKEEKKVIGIVDLDFEKEKNFDNCFSPENYEHLFVTETNDGQTLLLSKGGLKIFFDDLCDRKKEFEYRQKHDIKDLSSHIILMASYPGLARYINKKFNCSIKFDSLYPLDVFCKYISKEKLLNSDDIRTLLLNPASHSNFNDTIDSLYQKELNKIEKIYPNRWDFCQGHDVMKILLCLFHQIKKKNCSFSRTRGEEELLKCLSKEFHNKRLFNQTTLYTALIKWVEDYFPYSDSRLFSEIYSVPYDKME